MSFQLADVRFGILGLLAREYQGGSFPQRFAKQTQPVAHTSY
jgi:hypothetical protein